MILLPFPIIKRALGLRSYFSEEGNILVSAFDLSGSHVVVIIVQNCVWPV